MAVGRIAERPWAAGGQITARSTVRRTFSVDHRVLDVQPAVRFLSRMVELLESPALLVYDASST